MEETSSTMDRYFKEMSAYELLEADERYDLACQDRSGGNN